MDLKGGLHLGGVCIQWVVCFQGGLLPGGSASSGGLPTIQDTWDTIGYGQQAGGRQPTRMHSCLLLLFVHSRDNLALKIQYKIISISSCIILFLFHGLHKGEGERV